MKSCAHGEHAAPKNHARAAVGWGDSGLGTVSAEERPRLVLGLESDG